MITESVRWMPDREAVALFPSVEAVAKAVDALEARRVDRTHLSILGRGTTEERHALERAGFGTLREVLQQFEVLPDSYVTPDRVATVCSAPIASALYVAGTLATTAQRDIARTILSPIVAAVAVSDAAATTAHAFLLFRLLDRPEPYAEAKLAEGGLVMWVLVGTNEPEISHLLHRAGGELLRVQDVPLERQIASEQAARNF